MIVKTTYANFVRDTNNHSIINTNKEAYELYRHQRINTASVDHLQNDVDHLKQEINSIKEMLTQLLNRE